MSSSKNQLFDIYLLRALGCILVVLVHVSAVYYYEHDGWDDVTFFINQISRFGTPLFSLISGFLLFLQVRNRGFDFKRFLTSRFTKIFIPFVIWSLFYFVLMYYYEGVNPLLLGKKRFIIDFVFGNAFYHLYFMSIVFQFYLVFPLLRFIQSKLVWIFALLGSIAVNYYFLNYYTPGSFEGIWRIVFSQRAFLPNWIFYFIFGGFLSFHWDYLKSFSVRFRWLFFVLTLIVLILAVVEYKTVGSIPSNRITNMINIPILTFFFIGFSGLILKFEWLKFIFSQIGVLSMGIYLVHPLVLYLFQHNVPSTVWKTSLFPVVFLVIFIGSILLVKLIHLLPFGGFILTVPKLRKEQIK